jgi:Domain of unknown function (DUF4148)
MNKTLITLIVAALGTVAGAAQAAEADGDQWLQAAVATKSRDQVNAELQQARRDGTTGASGSSYKWLARATSVAQREDVRAEFRRARAAGTLPAGGEGYDGSVAQQQAATLSHTVAGLSR